jgi:hypothetical protein
MSEQSTSFGYILPDPHPPGFNYEYRPVSYFSELDLKTVVLGSITGEERRRDVQARLESSDFDPEVWGDWLTDSTLDDRTRRYLGGIHPSLMGGEYLPSFGEYEIEIARIVLASVLQDVISIRACRDGGQILYRVVDEYDAAFELAVTRSTSPLSLGELIKFTNDSSYAGDESDGGLVYAHIASNVRASGFEGMLRFVSVVSCFYPELPHYYEMQVDRFLEQFRITDD